NAAWGINGVKRTRILTLGLPLWAVLDGQAKIALLGHELGHEANGDLRSGWWVGSALWSLHTWRYLLTPVKTGRNRAALMQYRTGGMGLSLAAEWLMGILMAPVLLVLGVVRIALSDLADRSGQRAEHIADRLGAQLGGTAGALALESSLIAPDLLEFSLDVAVRRDPDADLWQTARSFQASVPESERDRRFRLARRTLQRSDATHPPTLRRIELLQAGPPLAASVLLSPEEERAVDAEVRKGERWVRARIVDRQKR
ncbi:MAG: peptidase family protein, partial [Frankiales bacterium]|nr:peptidase family protein [Frankiales bacterium]